MSSPSHLDKIIATPRNADENRHCLHSISYGSKKCFQAERNSYCPKHTAGVRWKLSHIQELGPQLIISRNTRLLEIRHFEQEITASFSFHETTMKHATQNMRYKIHGASDGNLYEHLPCTTWGRVPSAQRTDGEKSCRALCKSTHYQQVKTSR